MAVLTRINSEGKREYKVRYFWKDGNGKTKDSKTGWFDSADKAQAEADRLKAEKQQSATDRLGMKREQKLSVVYADWLVYLEKRATRETTENTTSDKALFNRARTIYNMHTPKDILNIRIGDIRESDFRTWAKYIDDLDLSGRTVRNYKAALAKFNWYLGDNGYYDDPEMDERVSVGLSRVKLKAKDSGEREDRRVPTLDDIDKIFASYQAVDPGKFFNIYWSTLWKVLFFSGCRVSELIGLTWGCVDFNNGRMDIVNAISERELKENVETRMKEKKFRLKNKKTSRNIPIFDNYSGDFYDYKNEYKKHFKLSEEQIKDKFVFPLVLETKEDVNDYQKQKNILRELKRACKIAEINSTDVQMMRHGCATWMCKSEASGGLGYTEHDAKDYFGHVGDDLLREVYARMSKDENTNRMEERYSKMRKSRKPKDSDETKREKVLNDIAQNPDKESDTIELLRYQRIKSQIAQCLKQHQSYEFWFEDMEIVFDIMGEYADMGIDLTEHIAVVMDTGEGKVPIPSIVKK